MCRYNMSFNDAVMNELRPHFKDEESLLVWLEVNMDHLMREYIARFKRPNIDGEQLLRKLNTLPNTSAGFLQQVSHGKICVRMHIQTSTAYESVP